MSGSRDGQVFRGIFEFRKDPTDDLACTIRHPQDRGTDSQRAPVHAGLGI